MLRVNQLIGFGARRAAAAPSVTWGALVKKASNESGTNFTTPTVITWDTEVYDNGGWHDNVSNTSRLTVPAGVSYIRAMAQIGSENLNTSSDLITIRLLKNGSAVSPQVQSKLTNGTGGTTIRNQIVSYPIAVSAGDYFEVEYTVLTDTSSAVFAAYSWFSIEKVE